MTRGDEADVVVVGGGPAGAVTAALLGRTGRDVLLLERARFPREKACAEFFGPRVASLLDDLGVLGRLPVHSRPAGMRVVAQDASFLVSYGEGRRGLGVPRPALDTLLLEAAVASGVRVERAAVCELVRRDGRVTGVVTRDGIRRAGVVVGADGLRSTVARALGVSREVVSPRRVGVVGRWRGAGIGEVGLMAVGRRSYCGIGPVGGGIATVGLAVHAGAWRKGESAASVLERELGVLPEIGGTLLGSARVTELRGATPLAVRVRRVAGPGYVLVGDAAGTVDPLTGEGVRRALEGAFLAAEACAQALSRRDRHPVSYAGSRQSAFRGKERICGVIQSAIASRRALAMTLRRLDTRPRLAQAFCAVLEDALPPRTLLSPRLLLELIAP